MIYKLRLYFFIFLMQILLIILLPIALLRPVNTINNYLFFNTFRVIAHWLLGITIKVEGLEKLYANRPAVILANHQHTFDMLITAGFATPFLTTLGKFEMALIPIIGQYYVLAGNILVKRNNKAKAMAAMEKVERHLIDKNISVLIFPEGHRNRKVQLAPFKKGAFYTATRTGLPLLPISIAQYGIHEDLNKFKRVTVHVKVHDPIITKAMNEKNIPELMKQSKAIMEEGISQMNTLSFGNKA
jgi:1-acyl-sn-glycerol-3-phosphate acyltransferase